MKGMIFTGFPRQSLKTIPALGAYRLRTHLARHGYDLQVVDYLDCWTDSEVMEIISIGVDRGIMFVGFSVAWARLERFDLLDDMRKRWPHLRIIIGAQEPHMAFYCGSGLFKGRVDLIFLGFAETALLRYLDHLSGNRAGFETTGIMEGIPYVISERTHPYGETTRLGATWLDDDPVAFVRALPLEVSRGCIFKCKFCNHLLTGKRASEYVRDGRELADELRRNHERWGIRDYVFADDTFNDSQEKLDTVAEAIQRSGVDVRFQAYLRYDLLHRNPAQLEQMVGMGLQAANFGIETLRPESRRAIGKGLTNEEITEVLLRTKTASRNVFTHSGFIVGLPGESEEDMRRTNDWLVGQAGTYLDSWFWAPLWIGNQLHLSSEFQRNAAAHGYELRDNGAHWTSPIMDSVSAERLADELNDLSEDHRSLVGFEVSELLALGVTAEELAMYGTDTLIHEAIDRTAMHDSVVNRYKRAKMAALRQGQHG